MLQEKARLLPRGSVSGSVPVKLFLETSRDWRKGIDQRLFGSDPDRALDARLRSTSLERFLNSVGKEDDKVLPERSKKNSPDSFPIPGGISPYKKFEDKSREISLPGAVKESGIGPVNKFWDRSMWVSLGNWHRLDGTRPMRLLSDRCSSIRAVRLPRVDGILPLMEQDVSSRTWRERICPNQLGIGPGSGKLDAMKDDNMGRS